MNKRWGFLFLTLALRVSTSAAADGEALFNDTCALCHQKGGTGSPGLAPPLADKALFVRLGSLAPQYIAGVMLAGMSGTIEIDGVKYAGLVMPSQARLTDEDLAAIGSYVLSELNGSPNGVSAEKVAEIRAAPLGHAALRELRRGDKQ